jgi:uncharacterized OsmC-like protein
VQRYCSFLVRGWTAQASSSTAARVEVEHVESGERTVARSFAEAARWMARSCDRKEDDPMATQVTAVLNGIDLGQLEATVEAVKETPQAAKLTFRAGYRWDDGFAGDAELGEIEQLGQRLGDSRSFQLRGDHPPELLGRDTGPTAVETLLAALGSCIAGTFTAQATVRGIAIEAIEVDLEAPLDLKGFLQLADVRPGPSGIKARVRVRSDASDETLRGLCEATKQTSLVYDAISNPVPIESWVERA